jgi:hypothetical protein
MFNIHCFIDFGSLFESIGTNWSFLHFRNHLVLFHFLNQLKSLTDGSFHIIAFFPICLGIRLNDDFENVKNDLFGLLRLENSVHETSDQLKYLLGLAILFSINTVHELFTQTVSKERDLSLNTINDSVH